MRQLRIVYERPGGEPKASRAYPPWRRDPATYLLAVAFASMTGLVGLAFLPATPRPASTISGPAHVIDGDTLTIGDERIRLLGLDAPESDQECERAGRAWHCGEAATAGLAGLAAGRAVRCDTYGRDRYGRSLAVCRAGDVDLGGELVARGLAVTYGGDARYKLQETAAMVAGRGLWAGEFVRPAEWRQGER